MPRQCVFCGSSPTTNEHVWSKWLRKALPVDEALPHTQRFELHDDVVRERTWINRPYELTTRAVCRECNNGWMSELEEGAKSLLGGMLQGRGRVLHREGQRTLAAWALLRAMMFDQTSPREGRTTPPEHYAYLLEKGEPPPATWVWLAAYAGTMPGFSNIIALDATMEGQEIGQHGERNVFVRTFSFGPVVFQVLATSNPGLGEMVVNWPEPNIHQIWPCRGSITWTPQPALTDRGLVWLSNELVQSLVKRSLVFEP